jgi:Leucine-rich repeat (LRR) protein
MRFGYRQLAYNNLNGTVPVQFGSLTKLQQLQLFQNQLSGSVSWLATLGKLKQVYVDWCAVACAMHQE